MSNMQQRRVKLQRQPQAKVIAREFRFPYVPAVALLGLISASVTALSVALGMGA